MKRKFTTTIDEELLKNLKIRANIEARSVNSILEDLIKVYLQYVNSKPA